MPIDREDGRHWCAPDQETPDADGVWVCPGCEVSWTRLNGSLWIRTDEKGAYTQMVADQAAAEIAAVPVTDGAKGKV